MHGARPVALALGFLLAWAGLALAQSSGGDLEKLLAKLLDRDKNLNGCSLVDDAGPADCEALWGDLADPGTGPVEETARTFTRTYGPLLGFPSDFDLASGMTLVSSVEGDLGRTLTYEPLADGVPVPRSEVVFQFDPTGRLCGVSGRFIPAPATVPSASIDAAEAARRAVAHLAKTDPSARLSADGTLEESCAAVKEGGLEHRFLVRAVVGDPPLEHSVELDGGGAILSDTVTSRLDVVPEGGSSPPSPAPQPTRAPVAQQGSTQAPQPQAATASTATAEATVIRSYDPRTIGTEKLTALRAPRPVVGEWTLDGERFRSTPGYNPRASSRAGRFIYDIPRWDSPKFGQLDLKHAHLLEASVYHTLEKAAQKAISWGAVEMKTPRITYDIWVNSVPGAQSVDNAVFNPGPPPRILFLGRFTRDHPASDASIMLHEYGHAIVEELRKRHCGGRSDGYVGLQSGAVNEGFADFFACCFNDNPDVGKHTHAPWLRTAANRDTYDQLLSTARCHHYLSPVVSGLAWDLRKSIKPEAAGTLVTWAVRAAESPLTIETWVQALRFGALCWKSRYETLPGELETMLSQRKMSFAYRPRRR